MRLSKYDAAKLAPIVQSSRSLAEVLRRLGLPPTGGNYRHISGRIRQAALDVLTKLQMSPDGRSHHELTRRIRELGLDTKHFRGRGWSRGETTSSHPSVKKTRERNSWSDADVFVKNSPLLDGRSVARRLLAMGWSYRCQWCDIVEWPNEPLVLHLDHINGINNDHRLENLRFCARTVTRRRRLTETAAATAGERAIRLPENASVVER